MKYFFHLFLFFSTNIYSQTSTIRGIVLNADDNSILTSASIFINNSSRGTIANAEGKFTLEGITQNNFELIISYSGFVAVSLKITPENIGQFHTIRMTSRKEAMEGILIAKPEKDGWKKWGKFFTESFIGQSDFAAQCVIENPKSLRFFFDVQKNMLTAYSNGNVMVRNNALGYLIKYQLEDFEYDFKKKMVTYVGYSGFQDLKTRSRKKRAYWIKNRKEVYAGSIMHFMRSLYADSIAEQGFDVHEKIRIFNNDSLFNKIYLPGKTPKTLKTETDNYSVRVPEIPSFKKIPDFIDLINMKNFSFKEVVSSNSATEEKEFYFENYLQIIYKNAMAKMDYLLANDLPKYLKMNQNSDALLVSEESLVIGKDGSYFNPVNLISSGYWGWYKMAEMLPSDFEN